MPAIHTARQVVGAVLIGIGVFFSFAMTVGMIRFPDAYTRLHAGTKGLTIGAGFMLVGSAIMGPSLAHGLKTGLIGVFLLVTNPISIHAVARANYRSERARHRLVIDEYQERMEERRRG